MARSLRRDRRIWELLAEEDAFWAICTDRAWHAPAEVERFFARGGRDVDVIDEWLRQLGLTIPRGRALDFGCGVGRLTRALAEKCGAAVGVDIASTMIARAQELNSTSNCTFVLNTTDDLARFDDDAFDVVMSLAVLQHVSDQRTILNYIAEFLRVCRPGGLVVFQLPSAVAGRVRVRRLLARLLPARIVTHVTRLRPYAMSLTAVPESVVVSFVETRGASVIGVLDDNRVGSDRVPSRLYAISLETHAGAGAEG